MPKIRRVDNNKTVANKKIIKQIKAMMKIQFPGLAEKKIANLAFEIFSALKTAYQYQLYVSENETGEIKGFMIFSCFCQDNFYFLDFLAAAPGQEGQGIGSGLYEFLREQAKIKNAVGVFFECLNDDPRTVKDKIELKKNVNRLKFFEKFGARPIINNRFEAKVDKDDNSTLLVFDSLDKPSLLPLGLAKKIASKIIIKKYSNYCPPDFINMVVNSFADDPVIIRESKYIN